MLRLPDEIELVDVPSLAESARGAPPLSPREPRRWSEQPDPPESCSSARTPVRCARGRARDPGDADGRVLREGKGATFGRGLRVPDSERTTKSHEEVVKVSDKATLIIRVSTESLGEGMEPVLMLLWQYLIETSYGALVMAFSTANQQMMGPASRKLYDSIVETGFIGEQPPPS